MENNTWSEEELVINQHFTNQIITPHQKQEFRNCTFSHCTMKDMIEGISFVDCKWIDCDFSNQPLRNNGYIKTTFIRCKGVGSDISMSTIGDCVFEDCQLTYGNFSECNIKKTTFKSCDLQYTSFRTSKLEKTKFENNTLQRAEFFNTSLQGIDLRSNQIEGIILGIKEIAGCTIDQEQAVLFIHLLDVIVE